MTIKEEGAEASVLADHLHDLPDQEIAKMKKMTIDITIAVAVIGGTIKKIIIVDGTGRDRHPVTETKDEKSTTSITEMRTAITAKNAKAVTE